MMGYRMKMVLKIMVVWLVIFCRMGVDLSYAWNACHSPCWSCTGTDMGGGMDKSGGPSDPQKKDPPPGGCAGQNGAKGGVSIGAGGVATGGDPVYLHSGEFFYWCHDISIPGRGMDLEIYHLYRDGKAINNQFGRGWYMNYYFRLVQLSTGNVQIINGDTGRMDEYVYTASNGGVAGYISPAGVYTTLVQNSNGSWTMTKTHGEKYNFDLRGVLTSIVDRNGNTISFAYSAAQMPINGVPVFGIVAASPMVIAMDYQLQTITDTLGRKVNFAYNKKNRLTSITDFNGRVVSFTYDDLDHLTAITKPSPSQFPAGLTKQFAYDSSHHLLSITDAKGQTFVKNQYDAQGRVIRQTLGGSDIVFNYGTNTAVVTDRKGFVENLTFDAAGDPLTEEKFTKGLHAGDPASFITTRTYDTNSNLLTITYPAGNGVKYTYDAGNSTVRSRGNLLMIRQKASMAAGDNDAIDLITRATYEPVFNFIKTITDPKGNVYNFAYDDAGNLKILTYPTVNGQTPAINVVYNANGQPIQVTEPSGSVTKYVYDALTALIKDINKDANGINAHTAVTYDTYGNVDKVTDANGHTVDYNFNALGWLIERIDALNFKTKFTYDANGNVVKEERQADAKGTSWQTTQYSYDILNELKSVTDPLNHQSIYAYDANQNLSSYTDRNGNTTAYQYDERDLLFKETDAKNGVTQYDYTANGHLKAIKDANAKETQYAYDGFDRVVKLTYANNTSEQYAYDKNSNPTNEVTPSTKQVNFVYDALNRLIAKNFPANAAINESFTYDIASRLTAANTTASKNSFTYDNLDRVSKSTQVLTPGTYTLTYAYDNASNRTKVTYPSGKTVSFAYDANDNMAKVLVNGAQLAMFNYDPLSRVTSRNLIAGQTSYQYDLANRLLSMNVPVTNLPAPVPGSGPVPIQGPNSYTYTYDNEGNRKTFTATAMMMTIIKNNSGTFTQILPLVVKSDTYKYDALQQLTSATGSQTHNYAYDPLGSRTTTDAVQYTANSLNQYTTVGGTAFAYDINGNLTYDGKNTYAYDEENRLIQVVNSKGTSTYAYDAFNRRVSKTTAGVSMYYVHDGDDAVAEYASTGAMNAEYVYGAGVDEPLSMTRGANTYYYFTDALGSVRTLTNAAGAVVETYDYDAYGNPTTTSNIGNPIMFTGRWYDKESGNYYYRARYYQPIIGRFLQRDPIGYYDSLNLYQYAGNNPTNWIDPTGEQFCPLAVPVAIGLGEALGPAIATAVGAAIAAAIEAAKRALEKALADAQKGKEKERSDRRPAKRKLYDSKKEAYEAAKKAGKGKEPVHHPDGKYGPHYHPDVPDPGYPKSPNKPDPHDHYNYPK